MKVIEFKTKPHPDSLKARVQRIKDNLERINQLMEKLRNVHTSDGQQIVVDETGGRVGLWWEVRHGTLQRVGEESTSPQGDDDQR